MRATGRLERVVIMGGVWECLRTAPPCRSTSAENRSDLSSFGVRHDLIASALGAGRSRERRQVSDAAADSGIAEVSRDSRIAEVRELVAEIGAKETRPE